MNFKKFFIGIEKFNFFQNKNFKQKFPIYFFKRNYIYILKINVYINLKNTWHFKLKLKLKLKTQTILIC